MFDNILRALFGNSYNRNRQSRCSPKFMYILINFEQAKDMIEKEQVTLIDVRTKSEYDLMHIKNAVNIPVDEMQALPLICNYFKNKNLENICVVSPDHGGATRARKLAVALDCPVAIIDKRRPKPNVAEIMGVLGDVNGKECIMVDDMIDTGGTIIAGIDMLLEKGATNVYVACTHPVFSGPAVERLKNSAAKEVVVTDTIILSEEKKFDKLKVVSTASMLAKTIESIENDLPVSNVFQEFDFMK